MDELPPTETVMEFHRCQNCRTPLVLVDTPASTPFRYRAECRKCGENTRAYMLAETALSKLEEPPVEDGPNVRGKPPKVGLGE